MNQRQCIILQGRRDWCRTASATLLADYVDHRTLWLTDHAPEKAISITQKKAQSQLGKEFDAVVFDGLEEFNPDSFGVIVGTIKAGGVLIVWLADDVSSGDLWLKRFKQISTAYSRQYPHIYQLKQGDKLPSISVPKPAVEAIDYKLTEDQQTAHTAILKVVHGHRRRPLVISSDRGRGKSAVLGMAAAELIKQGKQTIIITAPSLATVATVFEHAARCLPEANVAQGLLSFNDAELRFIAPDALLEASLTADLVMIDEAAAIPAIMLEQLLAKFSRLVFATTLHGYEGTGRGFKIYFEKFLTATTPHWKSLQLSTPIRWQQGDMIEKFSFDALLLDAEPVTDELIADCSPELCQFEQIDRGLLINDETALRQLFGLMVLAHYRTRPADLQMMLDRADISVFAMRYQGQIIASAWLVEEGELNDDISANVHAGIRRLKGHLLPQSLLAHVGITSAGSLKYQRIIRIAVHPTLQRQGIGSALLEKLINQCVQSSHDMLGASFAISSELLAFWARSNFIPVRLGLHKDEVSGRHSIMLLHATSVPGQAVLKHAQQRLQQQWPYLLHNKFNHLDPELVIALSQLLPNRKSELSEWDRQDVQSFAHEQRGFEFAQVALWWWLTDIISQRSFMTLTIQQQHLAVMSLLQQRDWSVVTKQLGYTGKTQAVNALREAVSMLLKVTSNH